MNINQPLNHHKAVTYRKKQFLYTIQGSGTAMLMVPPPGMGLAVFDKFTPMANKFTLIIPDFMGWEVTVRKPGESMIQLYVTIISKILEQENINKTVMMGYSAGGTIAQAFCMQHTEKVKAVILAGGYPKVASKGLDFQYRLGLFVLRRKPEAVFRFLGAAHARRKSFKHRLESKMWRSNVAGVNQFFTESYYFDCTNLLDECQIPFLTIYGKNENWISKHISYYERLPDHRTAIIEKAIHQYPVRKPHAMIHIMETYLANLGDSDEDPG